MRNIFKRILKDESGATAIEYALIAALVSIAAIGAYQLVGGALIAFFTGIANVLNANIPVAN
jgi:pilus assembly protein Flp/PilA